MALVRAMRVGGAVAVAVLAVALGTLVIADDLRGGGDPLGELVGYEHHEPVGDVLPLPEPGTARPAWLSDGRPVFITRETDGAIHVVEATDSHAERTEAVVWCETSGWFVEPLHGTKFDLGGRWVGGPGPTGLLRFSFDLDVIAPQVRVGPEDRALGRDEEVDRRREPAGPSCTEEDGAVLEGAWFHRRPVGVLPRIEDVISRPDRWWVTDVHLDDDGRRVCSGDRVVGRACPAGSPEPRVVPIDSTPGRQFLAAVEVEDGVLIRVIRLVEP